MTNVTATGVIYMLGNSSVIPHELYACISQTKNTTKLHTTKITQSLHAVIIQTTSPSQYAR